MGAILKERLFGYGTPYRVMVAGDGAVQAVETDAAQEAETLSQMLMALAGAVENKIQEPLGNWVYSMPFGRCGVDALPREHIQVHFCSEAWIDVLSHDGLHTRAIRGRKCLYRTGDCGAFTCAVLWREARVGRFSNPGSHASPRQCGAV